MIRSNQYLLMMRAIQLAEKGRGFVEPNPLVGAIITNAQGQILAEGYHERFGGPHAEINALKKLSGNSQNLTLFVTLEPCSTHGKTPPCTDAILNSKIRRVVIGTLDPNPRHRGRGVRILKLHGLSVETGVLADVVRSQNARFFTLMETRRPYVTLKMAESLDGKIATSTGESKWITSEISRGRVQELRRQNEAILVGTRTLKLDIPHLSVRNKQTCQPRRIFIARDPNQLKKYFHASDRSGDFLFYAKPLRFNLKKTTLVRAPFARGGVSIDFVLKRLGREGISSLLVEGGGEMAASFLEGGFVDEVYFFIAPLLIGGRTAKTSFEGRGFSRIKNALRLRDSQVEILGRDVLVHGFIRKGK